MTESAPACILDFRKSPLVPILWRQVRRDALVLFDSYQGMASAVPFSATILKLAPIRHNFHDCWHQPPLLRQLKCQQLNGAPEGAP
jgi:hypothetical protein